MAMLRQVHGHPQLCLPLKILGPIGVITMEDKAQQALNCEQDSMELAATVVVATELGELSLQATLT
jgi:hypothetical protein